MRGSEYTELRALCAIAEHGSFARAAAHLRITPSALSQTLRKLEERMGVRLINRTTRSVAPSEAGERLLARLLPALSEIDAALADVRSLRGVPQGTLRINAPRLAVTQFLGPLLAPFHAAYPEIVLDVVVEDALADIVAGRFDAGIRLGERVEKDMVAVKLGGDFHTFVVASPEYLARHGEPETPRDLRRHRCLNWRMPTDGRIYRWELGRDEEIEVAVEGPLITNDTDLMLRAALDGVGIAYLLGEHIEALIRAGKLKRVLEPWSPSFPGLYLYYPSRRQMPPTLRAFLDFVRDRAPGAPARGRGRSAATKAKAAR